MIRPRDLEGINFQKPNPHPMPPEPPKKEIDEKEAMDIYNELLQVLRDHNVTYSCAYKIALSFSYAFTVGAVELYNQEVIEELEEDNL